MKRMMPVTDPPADVSQAAPPWRGVHHVALVARDLDATISFYRDVLGMEVVFIAPAGELHGRHGAVRPGGESDRTGLHFFEYPQAALFGPPDTTRRGLRPRSDLPFAHLARAAG